MADDPTTSEVTDRFSGNYDQRLDPYFQELGRLTATWSNLEFNINDAIWELANVEPKAGTCLTSQLIGPGPRFRCLVALLHLRETPQEIIKRINVLSADTDAAARQRNRFIHDPIAWNKADGTIHRMEATADRQLKHDAVPVTLKEMRVLRKRVDHLITRFNFLYAHVQAKTPPWPRTQYVQSWGIRIDRYQLTPDDTPLEPEPPPPPSED